MKAVLRYCLGIIPALLPFAVLNAQQFDDMYKSTNANMILVQAGRRTVYTIKNATIIFLEDDNQLNITIPVSDSILTQSGMTAPDGITPVLLNVKVNIDPQAIQDNLTSSKQFTARGSMALNKMNKPVGVSYIPMATGTEELGNFNMFVTIRFNPSDFRLMQTPLDNPCIIQLSNAPVNRE